MKLSNYQGGQECDPAELKEILLTIINEWEGNCLEEADCVPVEQVEDIRQMVRNM